MKRNAPIAVTIGLCLAAVAVVLLARASGVGHRSLPEKALSVHEVSIAFSRYVAENGKPSLGPDANRDMTRLLLDAGFVSPRHVVDGQLLDHWGTPFAVFLCRELGEFDGELVISGQTVRPVQGAGPYLSHQVISAGPDREFGTSDDFVSWK